MQIHRSRSLEDYPGGRSSFLGQMQLAAEAPVPLLEGAHLRVQCDTCEPGGRLRLVVRNVGPCAGRLRAVLEGTVIE